MPLEKDLSNAPYHNDYSEDKKFHAYLFKPDTAVQVRELNGLQSMLQNQIERFGNNIFKRGTIIDGANFLFYDTYPYVKINDVELDGTIAVVENYFEMFVKNESGLIGRVIDYVDGFESTTPDLKTIYVKYINSGNSFNETAFSDGQILTVYDANNTISKINILSPGSNYSNADIAVTTPILLANVNSGQFIIGDTITNPVTGAAGIIVSIAENTDNAPNIILGGSVTVVNTSANVNGTGTTFLSTFANGDFITIYANNTSYSSRKINVVANNTFLNLSSNSTINASGAKYANTVDKTVFITYRPEPADLSAEFVTANSWSFVAGESIVTSNVNIGQVKEVYGVNAAGSIQTDSSGRIIDINMVNVGSGYTLVPHVTVATSTGSGANLAAQNFYGQITVSSLANSVGTGYAFGITEGYAYQKGYFIKIDPQTVIVSKYNNTPDLVTVGFYTEEEIITADIDNSLFDNVNGENALAPGADRLKLNANLVVRDLSTAVDDPEFFNLVEWSEGFPFKQNNRTEYNIIGDEMETRTDELSGSFVVDEFLVTTTDASDANLVANTFNVVVDPGTAYVNGKRIKTVTNYNARVDKSTGTEISTNNKLSINYENYIRVNNVGGYFEFDRANVINLYDTATGYIANTAASLAGTLTPAGSVIGTARLRSFNYEQGLVGSANAAYRAHVFDINMNAGKNFKDVKAIAYSGAINGIADVILEPNASGTANVAVIHNSKNNSLIFNGNFASPLNANNIFYQYRTIDTQQISNSGIITISLAASPDKSFMYSGTLTDIQKTELYVIPNANLRAYSALTGTVNVNSTTSNVTGTGTNFNSEVKAGGYISINSDIRRVSSVTNSTHMVLTSNGGSNATAQTFYNAWPAYAPVPIAYNADFSAATSGANNEILTINFGETLNGVAAANVSVAYNVEQSGSAKAKTVHRNQLVRLQLSNNVNGTTGPWSLGVPDVFRLRNVYRGASNVSATSTNITSEFYVNHNQSIDYYGLSTLNKIEKSSSILTTDDFLLVEFDCFTADAGFYNINSYVTGNKTNRFIEDNKALADLSTTINTLEIPELFGNDGNYYDLIRCIDFRPYADATANLVTSNTNITTNPSATVSFASTDRLFPVPGSIFESDVEHFDGRVDAVILDVNSNIRVVQGTLGSTTPPKIPAQTMRINNIAIPVYPALPKMLSSKTKEILYTGVKSGQNANKRPLNKAITTLFTKLDYAMSQPKNYTELEIGSMDRRISDLEYYQALTLSQSSVKDKLIPSSLAPNVDRFKYGFFVDNYDDETNSEAGSPEYRATIDQGFAGPDRISLNTVHTGIGLTAAEYTSEKIVSQNMATLDPVPPIVIPPVIVPDEPGSPIVKYIGNMTITPPTFKAQNYTHTVVQTVTPPAPAKSGKIICTAMNEAYGFGSFRNAIWVEHGRTMPKEYERGYHAIFLPFIQYLYKSKHKDEIQARILRAIMERVVRKRTADIWKQKRGSMDLEGRIYRKIFEPICFAVGSIIKKFGDK